MTRYVTEANTFMEPEIMTRLSVVLRAGEFESRGSPVRLHEFA